jgi:transcriptional regulator with XRE-family HTH domain
MEPIAKALRELLDAREMTETELMAKARLSPSTVTHYLRGSRGRRMDPRAVITVRKMAAALEVPPDHFIEYRPQRRNGPALRVSRGRGGIKGGLD